MELIASLLDDQLRDDYEGHNIGALVFLLTNEDVLLLPNNFMNTLLEKVYSFTPKANKNIFETSASSDWPDSSIVFTKRQQRDSVATQFRNNAIGGGGPARSNNRVVANRRRYAHDQFAHVFEKTYGGQPVEEIVPLFRGVQLVPPQAQVFSCQEVYVHFATYFEYYTKKAKKDREIRMKQEKLQRMEIKTPVPNPKHNSCHVCNITFKEGEYKLHIRSQAHADSVEANKHIYSDIDAIIKSLDQELAEKR